MSREENVKSTIKLLEYLEQRRLKDFSELFAEDGRWFHPYHSGLFNPETIGREGIYDGIKTASENFNDIQFPMKEILPFEDPNMIAMRFKGKLKLKNGNGLYENDYLAIFTFNEDGKISEWIEYYNPILSAKAFGLMDKIK